MKQRSLSGKHLLDSNASSPTVNVQNAAPPPLERRGSTNGKRGSVVSINSLNAPPLSPGGARRGSNAPAAAFWAQQSSLDTGFGASGESERRASLVSMQRNVLSTHVLDMGSGRPCCGMQCKAFKWDNAHAEWTQIGDTVTNAQGRIPALHPGLTLSKGLYKLRFSTKEYYARYQQKALFPHIDVVLDVDDASEHCHVPVLLNHYGYTIYRGH